MGETIDVLRQPIRVEPLENGNEPGMNGASPLLEHAAVGHLVGEGVLERVLGRREEPGLVEELRGLQPRQAIPQLIFRLLRRLEKHGPGDVLADDGGGLEKLLVPGREAVDARGENGLHGGGHLNGDGILAEAIRAGLAHQHLGLHERAHALLEEERVAFGSLDEQALEGPQLLVIAEQGLEERLRGFPGEGIDAELPIERLVASCAGTRGDVTASRAEAVGRLSTSASRRIWVSASIQCRSSKTRSKG